MSEHSPLIDRYIACWNEADAARRQALIAETFTEAPPIATRCCRARAMPASTR